MHRRCGALLFLSRVIVSGAGLGHTFFDICGMVFLLGFRVAFSWVAVLFCIRSTTISFWSAFGI
jgi:hypothetical protein